MIWVILFDVIVRLLVGCLNRLLIKCDELMSLVLRIPTCEVDERPRQLLKRVRGVMILEIILQKMTLALRVRCVDKLGVATTLG